MGHVEPGGEAGGAPAERVNSAAAWELWRRLRRFFPVWSLLPSTFVTPGAWTMMGVDYVSGFRRNRSTRQTFALLSDVRAETFETVAALAALNVRRQLNMLRAVIVAYVTFPLSLVATAGQIAPDRVEQLIRDNPDTALTLFAGSTLGALYYVMSWWRARQMVEVLDLFRIERGFGRQPPPEVWDQP